MLFEFANVVCSPCTELSSSGHLMCEVTNSGNDLFLAQLHFARAIGVLLAAIRARTVPAETPGEGLIFNLNRVSNGKLSTAARAIHEPPFFSFWHLWPDRWDGPRVIARLPRRE